jgi:hypothetical protein
LCAKKIEKGEDAMKTRILTGTFLAASLLAFGIGAAAQRSAGDQTQKDQTTQGQTNSGMMGQGQGMMGGGMMGMMGQMTTHHQQMTTLMNKMMGSMAAIQSEKDPEALKSKLAEHQALMNQMRSQMMQQGKMMQMMNGQIKQSCPGSGDTAKSPAK